MIGGWVCKYLFAFLTTDIDTIASDTFFTDFITNGASTELWFCVFVALNLAIIYMGVENGIERVSRIMMPILLVLAVIISVYSITRPGAMAGVSYMLIPHLENFSWMTVVSAMGQMFYSLSIAMGILITFGSYMKKDVSIEDSTVQVEIFDTGVAILAGMMAKMRASRGDVAQSAGSNANLQRMMAGMTLESLLKQAGNVPAEAVKSLNAALQKIRKG